MRHTATDKHVCAGPQGLREGESESNGSPDMSMGVRTTGSHHTSDGAAHSIDDLTSDSPNDDWTVLFNLLVRMSSSNEKNTGSWTVLKAVSCFELFRYAAWMLLARPRRELNSD